VSHEYALEPHVALKVDIADASAPEARAVSQEFALEPHLTPKVEVTDSSIRIVGQRETGEVEFTTSIPLPDDAKEDSVTASFGRGVLTIRFERELRRKVITVKPV
jgi:hypothetical protein